MKPFKPMVQLKFKAKEINSEGTRIYKNVTILTSGTFRDFGTDTKVYYPPNILQKYASNWSSYNVNLNHSTHPLDYVGKVVNPHWDIWRITGDIEIYPITQNARDVIALIDAGLVKGLSPELKSHDVWDPERGCKRLDRDVEFIGLAIVTRPADRRAKIEDIEAYIRI